jgi:tetratricopeptide (TPR) repeat protein
VRVRAVVLALLLLLLLLGSAPALADRPAAEFHATRGDKALQEKDWALAEENFRKALTEDASFHPARYGLSQAHLGAGRSPPGIEELRKFVTGVKADATAPPAWKLLVVKAEKQLKEIDASGADLQKVLDRWADDLVAIARKAAAKDPSTAKRAARRALELRPGDKGAAEVLEKLGESAKGPPVVLFNGKDLKNWAQAEFPYYQVVDGYLMGQVREGARHLYADYPVEGDFDIRMEARVLEEPVDGDSVMTLLLYRSGSHDYLSLGIINRKAYFMDSTSSSEKVIFLRKPIAELKVSFDPEQWTTYEMRFRGDSVLAVVNGEVLATEKRTERMKGGFVGINVQRAKAAIRKVEVQPR